MGSSMSQDQNFVDNAFLDPNSRKEFIDEIDKGYKGKSFNKWYVLNFAKNMCFVHPEHNITLLKFCYIKWLPEDISDRMFFAFNTSDLDLSFSIAVSNTLPFLIAYLKNVKTHTKKRQIEDTAYLNYSTIKLGISLENLKYIYENYNDLLDYNHLFRKAIRNGDVDIYDYLKDKVTEFVKYVTTAHNFESGSVMRCINEIETTSMPILTDIWQHYPELIKVIDCNRTVQLSNYDRNVIFLMFMANKLDGPYDVAAMIKNSTDLGILGILEYVLDNIDTKIFMRRYESIPDCPIKEILKTSYERRIK